MLTQKRVKELFYVYKGFLIKLNPEPHLVGTLDGRGYLQSWADGRKYKNHRLIWLWHFGYLPEKGLDHIDGCKLNNDPSNLREVSQVCNLRNARQRKSFSGVKGVGWDKPRGCWQIHIKVNFKRYWLGRSDCFLEAVCLRLAAEQCLNWGNCDSSSPAYRYVKEKICQK